MDQILSIVELASRIDWISALITGACCAAVGGFATAFARGFELEGWRYKIAWFAIFGVGIWPVESSAKTYVAPPIYEWAYEDRFVEELSRAPSFAALLEHHPESRKRLVRAAVKVKFGKRAALVGATELHAIMFHYLAQDLPRTSDAAVKRFTMAIVGLFHHLMMQDPGLCVNLLYGNENQRDAIKRFSRLSPVVTEQLGQVGAMVMRDAFTNPSPVPDAERMGVLQERVLARMVEDGNPIATDPDQAMSDPQRACFAAMSTYDAVSKVVPEAELGAFLRATLTLFFVEDEI